GYQRCVEWLVVEVTHRQRRRLVAVLLPGALMEVGQGLARDVAVAGRFVLSAASRRPVVAEDRPHAMVLRSEVDLHDLASRIAAHHHMEERLVGWHLERSLSKMKATSMPR